MLKARSLPCMWERRREEPVPGAWEPSAPCFPPPTARQFFKFRCPHHAQNVGWTRDSVFTY